MKYENHLDRINEKMVGNIILRKHGGTLKKSKEFGHYDFLWEKEDKKALIEIKRRNISKNQYKDTPIDFEKIKEAKDLKIPLRIIVHWSDAIGIIDGKDYYKLREYHRVTRKGDPDYYQPPRMHAWFRNEDFKIISEINND